MLVLGAGTGNTAGLDLAALSHILAQQIGVFVVNGQILFLAKGAMPFSELAYIFCHVEFPPFLLLLMNPKTSPGQHFLALLSL
jgi:hypothetical protein